jgi:hypothetical protein
MGFVLKTAAIGAATFVIGYALGFTGSCIYVHWRDRRKLEKEGLCASSL